MKEAFLQPQGIAYRHSEIEPQKHTIVLIHGLSGSLSVWYPFEEKLEATYNLVSIDLRGHGLSKRYKKYSDYELKKSAEDISAVLKELNIATCALVSHSLGGLVALELLHLHPEIITKAIFISPPAYSDKLFSEHARHPFRDMMVSAAFAASLLRSSKGRTDYTPFRNSGDWNLKRIFVDVSNMGQKTYLYSLNHLYEFANLAWWSEIKVPVLILHGSVDTMVPLTFAESLAKRIPNAKFIVYKEKNHLLPMNSIEEVTKDIKEFVQ